MSRPRRWKPPKEFSCQSGSKHVYDWDRSKLRLHWDYARQEWRSGRTSIHDCKVCDEKFVPLWREKMCRRCQGIVRDLTADYRKLQATAASVVAGAIRRREILPATAYNCVDCNEPALCYDHRDYTQPLGVDPVCRSCNSKRGYGRNIPDHLRIWRAGTAATFKPHPELRRVVQEVIAAKAESRSAA